MVMFLGCMCVKVLGRERGNREIKCEKKDDEGIIVNVRL